MSSKLLLLHVGVVCSDQPGHTVTIGRSSSETRSDRPKQSPRAFFYPSGDFAARYLLSDFRSR